MFYLLSAVMDDIIFAIKPINLYSHTTKHQDEIKRFTSQFCEQSKSIDGAERFPQSILLHYTAFITTLATLGTTWEQYGQAWAQLGDHLQTTS